MDHPLMYHVRNLTEDDFEFAVKLTDTMNWELSEDDFKFMLKLEPHGCFTLLDNSQKVGIVTTISFGKIGWFGNLIIAENHRNHGAGTFLTKHAISYLTSRGVECVGLYAYLDRVNFYERLGFEYDSEFVVLKGKGYSSAAKANIRKIRNEDIPIIINLDKNCFTGSRKRLLEPVLADSNNLCFVAVDEGNIVGYAAAKKFEDMGEVGPLVCKQGLSEVAVSLLNASLQGLKGLNVWVCLPTKESAMVKVLLSHGFKENFRVARMFFKPKPHTDCIYVAESLERG